MLLIPTKLVSLSMFHSDSSRLMGFTRRRETAHGGNKKTRLITRPTIDLPGQTILPSTSHKFLGVLLDQELRFKEQAAYALDKGTKWTEQYRRLAKGTKGISAKHMTVFYFTIALPKMLYAADLFLTTGSKKTKGTVGFINKLARVHRQALLSITGAMNTTATATLEAHTNIPPFRTIVKYKLLREAHRLACLPQTHPLFSYVRTAARRYVKRHRSPLHEIMNTFIIEPDLMEKIRSVGRDPKWKPTHHIQIALNKDKAVTLAKLASTGVTIYTDGSDIDGQVGAAAVLYNDGVEQATLHKHLETSKQYTIFDAELVGAILGAHMAAQTRSSSSITLGIDNQATIIATKDRNPASGQHLVTHLQNSLCGSAQNTRSDITIRWTPGHKGIVGNERADEKAKNAAQGMTSAQHKLPEALKHDLPRSKSASLHAHKETLKQEAIEACRKSKVFPKLHAIDPSTPSKNFVKIAHALPRRQAAMLIQLRSGHAPLNKHLHRMGKAESPLCPACHRKNETIHHFLVECKEYDTHRGQMTATLKHNARSIRALLSNPLAIPILFKFISDTKRLKLSNKEFKLSEEELSRWREARKKSGKQTKT